jgi:hypothetical protein
MSLEDTLAESKERHPSYATDPGSLVQTDIDGWEETDHFEILYGQPMMDDAKEESGGELDDDAIERYQDNKDAFWEGYIAGRKSKGKDIYAIARRLTATKKPKAKKPSAKRKSGKRSSGTPTSIRGMR